MKVRLADLKPNPMRDFEVDPVDEEAVQRLRASISEYGFWGGVVCRQHNGHLEIAAGHHRVEAAIQEGIAEGDVHVAPEIDDWMMIRIYAEENATQRGSANSTARAGSVAAALRKEAYDELTGGYRLNSGDKRDNLGNEKGIGGGIILERLKGVPGITKNTIVQDLASPA